jgi:hypothetical protein
MGHIGAKPRDGGIIWTTQDGLTQGTWWGERRRCSAVNQEGTVGGATQATATEIRDQQRFGVHPQTLESDKIITA